MNKQRLIGFGLLLLGAFPTGWTAKGNERIPCIVVSSQTPMENKSFDLGKFNRITFGNESMTISSSKDDSIEPITLPYSAFHHLEMYDDIPNTGTGSVSNAIYSPNVLSYNAVSKTLDLTGENTVIYTLFVFNSQGMLQLSSSLSAGQSLSLNGLENGAYVAVAINTDSHFTLKFIH